MRFMIEFVVIIQDGCIDWFCFKLCGLNVVGGSFLIFNLEIYFFCVIFVYVLFIIIYLIIVVFV